jgi:hypothetical protein
MTNGQESTLWDKPRLDVWAVTIIFLLTHLKQVSLSAVTRSAPHTHTHHSGFCVTHLLPTAALCHEAKEGLPALSPKV